MSSDSWHRSAAARLSPSVVCLALLLVAGAMPNSTPGVAVNDKMLHFLGFGSLALVTLPAVRYLLPRASLWFGGGVCALYATLAGGGVELLQSQLPYRSADWADFYADVLGAGAAAALIWFCAAVRLIRIAR